MSGNQSLKSAHQQTASALPTEGVSLDAVGLHPWHSMEAARVLAALSSSANGLNSADARSRLEQFGPNQLKQSRRSSAWKRLALQFDNPLVYVLLVTAGLTAALGHWLDTGVIVGVVIINAITGFVQESKAEQAIESLRDMLSPHAITLRDGEKTALRASELVPGDIVLIQGGDKVPADLRLLESRNLQVDEAALTGESIPVGKTLEPVVADASLGDRHNVAYSSTLVRTGIGRGVVVATGGATQIGQIAGMLEDVKGVDTPLLRRLTSFSRIITLVIVVVCVLVFLIGVLTGRDSMEMLMATVALAVSAIPEGLPAIMTIALAIGVKRMASRNAVIRKLPAVEALGSVTVICTDKAGTLTRNEMTVTRLVTTEGHFAATGTGYDPEGHVEPTTYGDRVLSDHRGLMELISSSVLCNESNLRLQDGTWEVDGDPTEAALLVLARKANVDAAQVNRQWPRQDVIPFEAEKQYMATLNQTSDGRQSVVCLKGSPERVLDLCCSQGLERHPLDREYWQLSAESMAEEGLRVLAIAEKTVDAGQRSLDPADVARDFGLLGLVGIMDPPRQQAVEAIKRCKAAGIRVKMITGDHIATARTIAKQLGIDAHGRALSGAELDQMDDGQFEQAVTEMDVFARVSPAHKLRLVQVLQKCGEVVAMTGDGVNDAPALKQADIGIAMGVTGTDVSKEASEMVLLDDNFVSIQRAVEEGRTVYANLRKTIVFILPTNGGECLTLIAALLLETTLPILPLHILWINLVTTVALAIALAFDPVETDAMCQPPRAPSERLIDRVLVWRIVYVSVLMTAGTFGLFLFEVRRGAPLETARAVAVNSIVFLEVVYLLNSRHLSQSVLAWRDLTANAVVWWGIAAVVLLQTAFTYLPVMNSLFDVRPLSLEMWFRIMASASVFFLVVEGEKALSRQLRARQEVQVQDRVMRQ